VYRLTVTLRSGACLCPVFVKAENRQEPIACARSEGIIQDNEKVNAARVNGELSHVDFGRSTIAIGEHQTC
jgi:hypothetical protein